MPPRACRLLLSLVLLGWASGCAHRSVPTAATSLSAPVATSPAATASRLTQPSTAFSRLEPSRPFAPQLVVTTQVAHGDLFPYAFGPAGPRYLSVTRLHRGQRAYVIPFATNYGLTTDRRSDLTYELSIRRPDGTVDGPAFSSVLWQGAVASPGLVLYPATTVVFNADATDPSGPYVVTARVTDHLAGETRELVHTFTLEDYHPAPLPAGFDAQTWFQTYYQQPSPELALPALPALALSRPSDQRAAELPALLGFYDQILADNSWLLPAFSARLSAAESNEAYVLSLVLGHHLRAAATPPPGVDFATWVRLEDFRTYTWPGDAESPLARTAQLEALWGRFFASGLYAPVERILAALAHHADLGAADRWQELQTAAGQPVDLSPAALAEPTDLDAPATPPIEVRRDVLLRNAVWSLRRHSRQHTLVRSYLDWVLRLGELSPAEETLLERILAPDTVSAPQASRR